MDDTAAEPLTLSPYDVFGFDDCSLQYEDLVKEGYTSMSRLQYERAIRSGQLYFEYDDWLVERLPAWQFHKQAPVVLPSLLPKLFGMYGSWVPIFLKRGFVGLYGLTPAETIMGNMFSHRSQITDEMVHFLSTPAVNRVDSIMHLTYRSQFKNV